MESVGSLGSNSSACSFCFTAGCFRTAQTRYISAMVVVSVPAMVMLLASCETADSGSCSFSLEGAILEKTVLSDEARVFWISISPTVPKRSQTAKAFERLGWAGGRGWG